MNISAQLGHESVFCIFGIKQFYSITADSISKFYFSPVNSLKPAFDLCLDCSTAQNKQN